MTFTKKPLLPTLCLVALPSLASASAPSGVSGEVAYILNSFMLLVCGVLVMFMAAGFAMLEAGMVRYRNVGAIVLKNMALYSIAGIMFYIIGYNLMFADIFASVESNNIGDYIAAAGNLSLWGANDSAAIANNFADGGNSSGSFWFFQMVFVATASSIVSGAVAERMKIWTFLAFVAVLSAILYPVTGSWLWGEGWLYDQGFKDFAGSTIVHSVGGWAALAAIILLGARSGRFNAEGKPVKILPSNVVPVCLGVFILWLGWFGFNGGSQLAMGSGTDVIAISNIFINTNVAAAAGVITVMSVTQMLGKKIDVYMTMNGALAGLVSITAEPLLPSVAQAAVIGAIGGLVIIATTPLLERFKLDDVVGAIPVHLFCGIWGTLIVPWSNVDAVFSTQLLGVASIGAFTFVASAIIWGVLKVTLGLRVHGDKEHRGLDASELGVEGMPYLSAGYAPTRAPSAEAATPVAANADSTTGKDAA